jgi:hypothetical protein
MASANIGHLAAAFRAFEERGGGGWSQEALPTSRTSPIRRGPRRHLGCKGACSLTPLRTAAGPAPHKPSTEVVATWQQSGLCSALKATRARRLHNLSIRPPDISCKHCPQPG